MNVMLDNVTVTNKDGRVVTAEQVYLRGAQIRLAIFPDMLRHAPMFKLVGKNKNKVLADAGQRRSTALRVRTGAALMSVRRGGGGGGRGDGR
eukprot:Trichotokara_eunicae@DN5103_c0_g1_i4.p1